MRLSTTEDKPGGIELIDKDIDHTDRIVFAHIVIERLRKQSAMVAMRHLSFLPWTVFVITSTKQLASRKVQYDVASVNQDDIEETIRLARSLSQDSSFAEDGPSSANSSHVDALAFSRRQGVLMAVMDFTPERPVWTKRAERARPTHGPNAEASPHSSVSGAGF